MDWTVEWAAVQAGEVSTVLDCLRTYPELEQANQRMGVEFWAAGNNHSVL